MKNNLYTAPLIEVIEIEIEDLLCESITASSNNNNLSNFDDDGFAW